MHSAILLADLEDMGSKPKNNFRRLDFMDMLFPFDDDGGDFLHGN